MAINYEVDEYIYYVGWSLVDRCYIGLTEEFPGIRVHGKTQKATLKELRFIIGDIIKDLTNKGKYVPAPFSYRTGDYGN